MTTVHHPSHRARGCLTLVTPFIVPFIGALVTPSAYGEGLKPAPQAGLWSQHLTMSINGHNPMADHPEYGNEADSEAESFCLSAQDAANLKNADGLWKVLNDGGNCTFPEFTTQGNTIYYRGSCKGAEGGPTTMDVNGTVLDPQHIKMHIVTHGIANGGLAMAFKLHAGAPYTAEYNGMMTWKSAQCPAAYGQ